MKLSQDTQVGLTVFISSMLIMASLAWVVTTPRQEEEFFALATLGSNMKAEAYYPDNTPRLRVGDMVEWYVMVYNRMASVQYVAVRFKILNSAQAPPDDVNHLPSPVNHFVEFRRLLARNETWQFPFDWKIRELGSQGDSLLIKSLVINGADVGVDASAPNGFNFRIVIELWTYNPNTESFDFSWSSGRELRSAWNQIWFNVTRSV